MNNNIKNTLRVGLMAAAGAAAMLSCTDTWNDHYDAVANTDFSGTTLQALEEKAPDFAAVVKAVGFDRELSSDNVYTIWAPTSFNRDSVLGVAAKDPAAVVDQFLKNHMARYSVSQNGSDQKISLMSNKFTVMTGAGAFGTANIQKANLSCSNGVLHLIDGNINYSFNVYERIKNLDDAEPGQHSLYNFLKLSDADSLDENRSVSRGVDEDGNKIWVDSVTIRNNTVLRNVDAFLYAEDSSYIAIIPTAKAYNKRYEIAKSLLNYAKTESNQVERDSLQEYYANMFAMTDLYYNKNTNEEARRRDGVHYDSLRSTNYTQWNWPHHLYYKVLPPSGELHPDKELNDILDKSGTPFICSNGEAYSVDKYPMSVTEQFFKKIDLFTSYYLMDKSVNADGSYKFSSNVTYRTLSSTFEDWEMDTIWVDETLPHDRANIERLDSVRLIDGARRYSFTYFESPNKNTMNIAYEIPDNLSGTYQLYLVTSPIWAKNGFENKVWQDDPRSYHFRVNVYERNNKGDYDKPTDNALVVNPDAPTIKDGNFTYYVTDYTNKIDTLYLGDVTFAHSYHGLTTDGSLIQLVNYVKNSEKDIYSIDMLLSRLILKPKFDESEETGGQEAKRR